MVPLLLAGAAALAIGPPIKATANDSVTRARIESAEYWVEVGTFNHQHIPWTVMCTKAYTGKGVSCQAHNADVLRDALTARFDGDDLLLTFKGKDQFGSFQFVVEFDEIPKS